MEKLSEYISFDLEFNTVAEISHIIQVSAVKFRDGVEVDNFDTYVYTDVPLQSFINGLTGITSEKIAKAPKLDKVLADFKDFVGKTALVGYNALKSDLPLLAENDLDLTDFYKVDLSGHGHNSLEDARMTALVYEKFMEFDENKSYLTQQEEEHGDNPFAALGGFFS